VIVKVTKEHIRKGTAKDCYKCPVALALNALGFRKAAVGPYGWGVRSVDEPGIAFPMEVSEFIERFDHDPEDARLEPFTFRTRKPKAGRRGR
jgi:hypothetical protein